LNRWRRAHNTLRIGALAMVQRTVPRWPAAWIERAQRKRLHAIVAHACATVPFYRRTFDELRLCLGDIRDIGDLADFGDSHHNPQIETESSLFSIHFSIGDCGDCPQISVTKSGAASGSGSKWRP
jgi:hypothetical protein